MLQGTRAAWRWWATARAPPAYTTSWPPMLSLTVSHQKYLIIRQKIFKTDLCLLTWKVTSSSSAVTLYCYWPSLYCFLTDYWEEVQFLPSVMTYNLLIGFLEICKYVFRYFNFKRRMNSGLFTPFYYTVLSLQLFIFQVSTLLMLMPHFYSVVSIVGCLQFQFQSRDKHLKCRSMSI